MPEKSYVSMERQVCPICGDEHDTGSILLDRRLRESMDRHTVTGMGLCDDCDRLDKDGYVALVAIDPTRSTEVRGGMRLENAYRTGRVVHIRRQVFGDIFDCDAPEGPMAFFDDNAMDQLLEVTSIEERQPSTLDPPG